MSESAFRRLSRANLARAYAQANKVAQTIDNKHGTRLETLGEEQRLRLLRLQGVALRHHVPLMRVLEIIQAKYRAREAHTTLGVRVATLTSDNALEHAHHALKAQPKRRAVTVVAGYWTGDGLAALSDATLAGQRVARTHTATAKPYRGRPE